MAKKRKKDKEEVEEYEFTPPDFDEKQFLSKELTDIKTGLITVIFAIALGVIAAVVTLLNDDLVIIAFFVGIAGIAVLKQFYAIVRIDTSEFKKKNWAGNIASFFFTFLAIWVLLMNVPFADHSSPKIEDVTVWVDDGTRTVGIEYRFIESSGNYGWVSLDPSNYSDVNQIIHASESYSVAITANITDNGKLATVQISGVYADMTVTDMTREGDHMFRYTVSGGNLGSSLMFTISATDSEGNSESFRPVASIAVLSP